MTKSLFREGAIRNLKGRKYSSPAQVIDAALNPADDGEDNKQPNKLFADTKPWPEPVDGGDLLDELVTAQRRFLVAPGWVYELVALWSVFTHAFESFDCLPLLVITAPSKRAGKTTLITLLSAFARRAVLVSSMTAAVLFRIGEKYQPTLLIDEVDTILRDNEGLRGIIDGGHTRATAFVPRWEGDSNEVRFFTTCF